MFLTELFSRPAPRQIRGYEGALRFVESLSLADRFDAIARPADFPRMAREMAWR